MQPHLPFYRLAASVHCPLRALVERHDRGCQSDDDGCPRHCQSEAVNYPAHTKIIGRGNSLLALDERKTIDAAGFDRIVLNL